MIWLMPSITKRPKTRAVLFHVMDRHEIDFPFDRAPTRFVDLEGKSDFDRTFRDSASIQSNWKHILRTSRSLCGNPKWLPPNSD